METNKLDNKNTGRVKRQKQKKKENKGRGGGWRKEKLIADDFKFDEEKDKSATFSCAQ